MVQKRLLEDAQFLARDFQNPQGFVLLVWDENGMARASYETGKVFPAMLLPEFVHKALTRAQEMNRENAEVRRTLGIEEPSDEEA